MKVFSCLAIEPRPCEGATEPCCKGRPCQSVRAEKKKEKQNKTRTHRNHPTQSNPGRFCHNLKFKINSLPRGAQTPPNRALVTSALRCVCSRVWAWHASLFGATSAGWCSAAMQISAPFCSVEKPAPFPSFTTQFPHSCEEAFLCLTDRCVLHGLRFDGQQATHLHPPKWCVVVGGLCKRTFYCFVREKKKERYYREE